MMAMRPRADAKAHAAYTLVSNQPAKPDALV